MDYLAAMRAFVRSVDLGSFSRAAAEAGVKVSTVSRYVSGLEADLGAALLNRSTRSLHLTEAGRMFYERGAQIFADVQDARYSTASLNERAQGSLRINVPTNELSETLMCQMLAHVPYPCTRARALLVQEFQCMRASERDGAAGGGGRRLSRGA
jgi:DNA-binding transcriptional LysR family regulator